MDKFIMMPKGFMGLPMDEEFVTTAENKKNTQIAINDWMLGPENPSNEPTANKTFWVAVGKAMQCDEKEARRRRCSSAEGASVRFAASRRCDADAGTSRGISHRIS